MLGAGHGGGAAAALRQEPRVLLRPVVEAAGPHPSTTRQVAPTPAGAAASDEGPLLVHGESAVVSGEVQWEVVGRQAVLQVVERGVRILEACRGVWVSGGKVWAAGLSQRAGERRLWSRRRKEGCQEEG